MSPDYRVATIDDPLAADADAPGGDEAERRDSAVSETLHGARLDKALVAFVPEFSRSHLQTLIEGGHVAVDGRVPRCRVTRSSGSPLLDDTTCRLIVERYRFKPAHDAQGRPFESQIVENEEWVIERDELP